MIDTIPTHKTIVGTCCDVSFDGIDGYRPINTEPIDNNALYTISNAVLPLAAVSKIAHSLSHW